MAKTGGELQQREKSVTTRRIITASVCRGQQNSTYVQTYGNVRVKTGVSILTEGQMAEVNIQARFIQRFHTCAAPSGQWR